MYCIKGVVRLSRHDNLNKAKQAKNDEFYTQIIDIEKELEHYKEHFYEKVILCNCDDPKWSKFWLYLKTNFNELGLSKLISTHYQQQESTYKLEYDGFNEVITKLQGNGDFRSPECIEVLKEADIVVTNPPFSLFREYVAQLIEYDKKFLIIGSLNAITYKEIFPLIKNNELWTGYNKVKEFVQVDNTVKKFGNIQWYTNLDIGKRHEILETSCFYRGNEEKYPIYDNYPAINVDKVNAIPDDYFGVIGVPVTFLDKYCPEQFEIIGLGMSNLGLSVGVQPYKPEYRNYRRNIQKRGCVDGDLYMVDDENHPVVPYARVLIQRNKKE